MNTTAILSRYERTIRGKLNLFLRLRSVRLCYEQTRPLAASAADRLRFDLAQLELSWGKVIQFQQVIGLDAAHFSPREHFEKIYVISAFADREFHHAENTILDTTNAWAVYTGYLGKLSHEINPFEFGEISAQCYGALVQLNRVRNAPENIVSFDPPARLPTENGERLKMKQA